ncbi:HD domain-containing protein [Virgibacillus sp. 179-BFC.A HS]|uniref:HD domain-containing protein n=1 Tax=Tigheibacillus jepli TaxID=3035914 RepID=A0ABU5CKV1_9BACI|nr:HD domain-containing protein [Virgibacillus sp. 179-BFC.A HS]MDY0406968.1 HD domain-containing protein [Virgibacillus sp. 179-BFC.A HS]
MKEKAKAFAIKAHHGQQRKTSNEPYVTHPIRVAKRLEANHFSDELVCAAYLHDVVEDTPYEMEDIQKQFGQRVAQLVAAHTEDKSKSWQERKEHTIAMIKDADKEVKYLIVADKLDNLLELEKELKKHGSSVWDAFNAGRDKQKWYNQSIAQNMYHGLKDSEVPDFFGMYEEAIKRVFG